jgi:hypothetical protein
MRREVITGQAYSLERGGWIFTQDESHIEIRSRAGAPAVLLNWHGEIHAV